MKRFVLFLTAVLVVACSGSGQRILPDTSGCDGACPDGGSVLDGGAIDGGAVDAGPADAGLPDAGDGLGRSCSRNADCPTHLCLPVDGGGVCTRSCADTETDCVAGWGCSALGGTNVCQCAPSAEICDGLDNDCNGTVDDQAASDAYCGDHSGSGMVCIAGTCRVPPCGGDDDCQLGERCDTAVGKCRGVAPQIRVCLVDPQTNQTRADTCFPPGAHAPSLAFGAVATGVAATGTIRISNEGSDDLSLSDLHIAPSAGFELVPPADTVLHAGGVLDLSVHFTPTSVQSSTATLVIASNDTAHPEVDVALSGAGGGSSTGLCTSPANVDFGFVAVGTERTMPLTVWNCGAASQTVTQLSLTPINGGSVFTVATAPTVPFVLAVGQSLTVPVTYAPTAVETPPTAADSARLTIGAAAQTNIRLNGRGSDGGCVVDGGSGIPTAGIRVTTGGSAINPDLVTLTEGETVALDASPSQSPSGVPLSVYNWRLVSQPAGGSTALMGQGSSRTLVVPLQGDYVVELIVQTATTCISDATTVTLHVGAESPADVGIVVRLTWPQAYGDVDLHYVGPGGTYYQDALPNPSDLDWRFSLATATGTGIPTPTGKQLSDFWGLNNTCNPNGTTSDDATMDVDQRSGYGPEQLTHRHPFDGTYNVKVHYYCNGSGTTVSPHVAISVHGTTVWEASQANMQTDDVWEAAAIVVSNGGTNISVVPLTTPIWHDTHGCSGFQ